MSFLFIENKDYSYRKMRMTWKRVERSRIWLPRGKVDEKCALCNHYWTIYEDIWITHFCWGNWQIPGWEKLHAKAVAWSHDMEGHAQKCVERHSELANKKVEQLLQSFASSFGWSPIQTGRTRICWRTVRSLLTICLEMVVFLARIGRPWHLVVREQACKISHEMDSSMWQTIGKINFIHSSRKRFPTILSCGKHGTALSTRFIPRLRLCWRLWGFKINFGRSLLYLWKSKVSHH